MTITSRLRFLYIFWGSGLLCAVATVLDCCCLQCCVLTKGGSTGLEEGLGMLNTQLGCEFNVSWVANFPFTRSKTTMFYFFLYVSKSQ